MCYFVSHNIGVEQIRPPSQKISYQTKAINPYYGNGEFRRGEHCINAGLVLLSPRIMMNGIK